MGGVLLDPHTRTIEFFSWVLPADLVSKIPAGTNPIHQLELLPVLMSFKLWRDKFTGKSAIAFVDNEGAKAALIDGTSDAERSSRIVASVDGVIAEVGACVWYDRVPSASNLADAPSRGEAPVGLPGWQAPTEVSIDPLVKGLAGCHLTFGSVGVG